MADFNYGQDGIKLENRYGSHIALVKLKDQTVINDLKGRFSDFNNNEVYTLEGDLDYMRILFNGNEYDDYDIYAVDPSGGPFIAIDNMYIKNEAYQLKHIVFNQSIKKYVLAFN